MWSSSDKADHNVTFYCFHKSTQNFQYDYPVSYYCISQETSLSLWKYGSKQEAKIQAKISPPGIPGSTNMEIINWGKSYKILPKRTEYRNYQVNKNYFQIMHRNKIYADIVKCFL